MQAKWNCCRWYSLQALCRSCDMHHWHNIRPTVARPNDRYNWQWRLFLLLHSEDMRTIKITILNMHVSMCHSSVHFPHDVQRWVADHPPSTPSILTVPKSKTRTAPDQGIQGLGWNVEKMSSLKGRYTFGHYSKQILTDLVTSIGELMIVQTIVGNDSLWSDFSLNKNKILLAIEVFYSYLKAHKFVQQGCVFLS